MGRADTHGWGRGAAQGAAGAEQAGNPQPGWGAIHPRVSPLATASAYGGRRGTRRRRAGVMFYVGHVGFGVRTVSGSVQEQRGRGKVASPTPGGRAGGTSGLARYPIDCEGCRAGEGAARRRAQGRRGRAREAWAGVCAAGGGRGGKEVPRNSPQQPSSTGIKRPGAAAGDGSTTGGALPWMGS